MVWLLLAALSPLPVSAGDTRERGAAQALPLDPAVRTGRLENGLTYYLRENAEPQNRAMLRLAVNAGAVLETEEERGLAHFVEHMAFNGTAAFPGGEIVRFLEGLGMRFGPDVNATTGFDETVYMLEVPTDDVGKIETAVHILEQWAHAVTFDPEEIERERGVVLEEWRLGQGAQSRIRDRQYPVLFRGSRYARRQPIGVPEVIRTADRERLLGFYRRWYRPDLMAVVAVGDFDADELERLVHRYLGAIPAPDSAPQRPVYPVPDHPGTLFAVASDRELSRSSVSIYNKIEARPLSTADDYREGLRQALFAGMLNSRFSEMARSPDAPFLSAGAGTTQLVRTRGVHFLTASVQDQAVAGGLEALVHETRRVAEHGFLESELERTRRVLLRRYETAWRERSKAASGSYAREYVRHFLRGEAAPGIEVEYRLVQDLLPGISLAEINELAAEYLAEANRVVLVSTTEPADGNVPTEEELSGALRTAMARPVEPYLDDTPDAPLLGRVPEPGSVMEETVHGEVGVIEWRLSNGVRVVLKPTPFRNDEVLFNAFAFGGTSRVPDEEYRSAFYAAEIIDRSGLGPFTYTDLTRMLAGKRVQVTPYIRELTQGMSGSSSVEDIEELFQLIHLYFTEPRFDSDAYETFLRGLRTQLQNRELQPDLVFSGRLQDLLSDGHPRRTPMRAELLPQVDLEAAHRIYRDRFQDASGFTFLFVGNLDPDAFRGTVETYLGGLPAAGDEGRWNDIGVTPPQGVVEETVRAGIEPRSRVAVVFHGPHPWSPENNYRLQSLGEALRLRLRESIREEEGGTYSVAARTAATPWPREEYTLSITFGTSPQRTEELTERVFQVVRELSTGPIDEGLAERVRLAQLRSFEQGSRTNRFWLDHLRNAYLYDLDPAGILDYPRFAERLDGRTLREAAGRYLDLERTVRLTLHPTEP